jgi:class 3 adenylate cyclase/tetratricopeptide (TPR) repeat protein
VVFEAERVPAPSAPGGVSAHASQRLQAYVPRMLIDWLRTTPNQTYREIHGTLVFVDISGFTALTERLARRGKVGAEEMSGTLDATFTALLDVAYQDGAGLVKWGGDAVLLLFDGPQHAARACRAAHRMRATLRERGRLDTSAGRVSLRMSVGIHSGVFTFFLVGDPAYHRELVVAGPVASATVVMEATADAGEIGISPQTAALLPPSCVGRPKGAALLLRSAPDVATVGVPPAKDVTDLDLGRVLPVAIREHLLAQPGDAEHRTVTVAFVQFSGTDALLEQRGPAALAEALDEVIANVQRAAAAHGVTFFETDIDRDGGKIMLTAGAPVSHGHDEDRMLRAARLVVERAGALPLRVGVNRGSVFAGDFGPFFRRTYSVKGDAINLAARVMGQARPGELLATRAVVDRVAGRFEVTPLLPFRVKGKSQPVEALAVGAHRGGLVPAQGGPPQEGIPLLGRATEMAVLTARLDDARASRGRVVELVGEPGIGKSRLVAELTSLASDAVVLSTVGEVYETSTPYFAFRSLLGKGLGLPPGASPAEARAQLQQRIEADAPGLTPWLPLVGIPLDLPFAPTPETARLDPRFHKTRVHQVIDELLAVSLSTLTLFVFDDAHLMDDASADLLRHLAGSLRERPWMVLTTRRDGQSGGFAAEHGGQATELRLGPLDDVAAKSLAVASTAESPLPPHELAQLAARAGGNPLFLRGLARAARETGSLDGLPDSLEDVVTSLLDRLPPRERTVLRYAAVLGTAFEGAALAALLAGEQVVAGPTVLARLSAFLEPESGGRYRFQHDLVRDAAYEGLPYRRRQRLHGRVGETIEASVVDPDEQSELLSLHFFHAGRMDRAWRYSRTAGERAAAKYAYVEAAELFGRATVAARALPDLPALDRAAVEEALGDARFRVGVLTGARDAFRSARQHVRDDARLTADLLRKEAEVDQRLNRLPQALRTLSRAMALLAGEGSGDPEAVAERSRLAGLYAVVRQNQGRYRDSMVWGRRAEADATAALDLRAMAEAYDVLSSSAALLGVEPDRPYGELALGLYEELGDRAAQSQVMNNLGVIAGLGGKGPEALAMFRGAEAAASEAGDTLGAAATRVNIGDMLLRQGRLAEAEPLLRALLPVLTALGLDDFHAAATRTLGLALTQSQRLDDGMALLKTARIELVASGQAAEVVETDAAISEALLEAWDAPAAEALARDAATRAEALDAAYLLPTLQRVLGAALAEQGRLLEAQAVLAEALRCCESQGQLERGFVLAEQAKVAQELGDAAAATRLSAESAAALDDLDFVGSGRYRRN